MVLRLRTLVAFLVISLFTPLSLFAQGYIEGTVTDAQSGDPIPGAQVVVQGTSTGAATASDGTFTISNVPTNRASMTCSPVGTLEIVNVPSDAVAAPVEVP